MSGYYSDPISDPTLRKEARPNMTHTNNQTVFSRTSKKLFKAVIGSPKTRAGSKYFIEGEYTFSYGPQQNGSYIELNHITFNSKNRADTTTTDINPPAGDSAGRGNVKPKMKGTAAITPSNLPTTPKNNHIQGPGGYSSISPSVATMANLFMLPAQPQFVPCQHYGQTQQPITGFQDLSQQHQPVPNQYTQTPQPSGSAPKFQPQLDPATPYAGTSIHTTPATGASSYTT